ncbi:alpha/beta fold hydrolase [Candidatus Uhrbacteria bacterium]|nr:alpha/beta fold hydrolase [Candidatus Uhrbacteria bacterium]
MERIALTTTDGMTIIGNWSAVAQPHGWALLLHMMPATKESYAALADALAARDVASLAIDERGHGESTGGPDGYQRFTDAEQQAKIYDVAAAMNWLIAQGAVEARIIIVGASIGANLALQWLATHPIVPAAALLSPGLDYRGIRTEPLAESLAPTQHIFLAAGGTDDEYSTASVHRLANILANRATTRLLTSAGHGTTMFEREPACFTETVGWIVRHFQ